MRVHAVIGANYGDEGKGLLTDYLCAGQPGSLVVRFNGGAQAGHTVQTPEGKRHIFNHFGAGTFAGAPTYLSRFFVVNPLVWGLERTALRFTPETFVHPDAPVSTPWDVLFCRALENSRGDQKHGSVGLGVWETVLRHRRGIKTQVKHMNSLGWHTRVSVVQEYFNARAKKLGVTELGKLWNLDKLADDFAEMRDWFYQNTTMTDRLPKCKNLVFEGAQGLLLDETNEADFPYISASRCGMTNVAELCQDWGIEDEGIEQIYVTRTYLTRHGPGPFPAEDPELCYEDPSNTLNQWQGKLRFGRLTDHEFFQMLIRIYKDTTTMPSLAVTHMDQCGITEEMDTAMLGFKSVYLASGPTRDDVRRKYD